jgi:NTE family protein
MGNTSTCFKADTEQTEKAVVKRRKLEIKSPPPGKWDLFSIDCRVTRNRELFAAIKQAEFGWCNLVFEGGGAKCVALCGAVHALDAAGVLQHIRSFIGSSAGSIIAMMLASGYNSAEIVGELFYTEFGQLVQNGSTIGRIYQLIDDFGYNSGELIYQWLQHLLEKRGFAPNATFADLYAVTQRTLVVTGSNISTGHLEYFDHVRTPEMQVATAVRISISIPFYFTPVIHDEQVYVDGGVFHNYPIDCFDIDNTPNPKTLGLKLLRCPTVKPEVHKKPDSLLDYAVQMFSSTLEQVEQLHSDKIDAQRTIYVPCGNCSTFDFDLSKERKVELLRNGVEATFEFLAKWASSLLHRRSFWSWMRHSSSPVTLEESEAMHHHK